MKTEIDSQIESEEIPHSAVRTPHSDNPERETTTRTGKVARLPVEVRETVNRMLESGVRFNDIIKHLDELGYHGIHDYNISRWKTGGYQDWLALKERLACAKVRADSARDLIRTRSPGCRPVCLVGVFFGERPTRYPQCLPPLGRSFVGSLPWRRL